MTEEPLMKKTFRKSERLNGTKQIEAIFRDGKSFASYPLRVVYVVRDEVLPDSSPVNLLISVPKKRFKRAVKRNRIKRLVREAYRLNKNEFHKALNDRENVQIDMAIIYLRDELPTYTEIESAMLKMAEELTRRVAQIV